MLRAQTAVRWIFALSVGVVFCSCSQSSRQYLGMSEDQLMTAQGPATSEEVVSNYSPAKLKKYSNGLSYQIEKKHVVAIHREPVGVEKNLQHWLQQPEASRREWNETEPDTKRGVEHRKTASVNFLNLKRSVFYDVQSGEVFKVIEYAAP